MCTINRPIHPNANNEIKNVVPKFAHIIFASSSQLKFLLIYQGSHSNQVSLRIPHAVISVRKDARSLYVKCPLLLSDFNQNSKVLTNVSKTSQYQIS
jgi:hypothetical protein